MDLEEAGTLVKMLQAAHRPEEEIADLLRASGCGDHDIEALLPGQTAAKSADARARCFGAGFRRCAKFGALIGGICGAVIGGVPAAAGMVPGDGLRSALVWGVVGALGFGLVLGFIGGMAFRSTGRLR